MRDFIYKMFKLAIISYFALIGSLMLLIVFANVIFALTT